MISPAYHTQQGLCCIYLGVLGDFILLHINLDDSVMNSHSFTDADNF